MRFLFFGVPLVAAAALIGCRPSDPNLTSCETRKPGVVLLGTGESVFEPIGSAGVDVEHGDQGGEHIWVGLSCRNLGPKVSARITITDVATGAVLTAGGSLLVSVDLDYDGHGSDSGAGIYGYLDYQAGFDEVGPDGGAPRYPPEDLTGRAIKMAVDVNDACRAPSVHAEVMTVISSD